MAVKRTKPAVRAQAPAKKSKPAKAAPAKTARRSSGRPVAGNETASAATAQRGKVARPRKAGAAAMFQKVAFTLLSVTDATRARGFYEEVLGLKRGLASPDGVWTEYDLPGGGCVALFRHPDPKAARAPGGGASVALEVADLDALNERLKRAGVVYQGDMVHGPHCRMSNILDSEGNSLILHQLNRS